MQTSPITLKLLAKESNSEKANILVEFNNIENNFEEFNKNNQSNTSSMMAFVIRLRSKPLKNLLLLVLFLTILFIYYYFNHMNHQVASNYPIINNNNNILSSDEFIYSIIIDAGSTGSRIHVFRLKKDGDPLMPYRLVNQDLFKSIKPGLSAYSTDTQKAAESLKPLLDAAVDVIPKREHKTARITLKATAGLRLLSESIANDILQKVEGIFDQYPFFHEMKNHIEILDGSFEGIYSWLTLTYAQDGFKNENYHEACTLDLGGGSTQVTFIPKESVTLMTASKDNLVDFRLDKLSFKVFTKSFLGYGMMSARMSIFKTDLFSETKDANILSSVCLKSNFENKWKQQNIDYTIKGVKKRERNFDDCYSNVVKLVENKLSAPVELRKKKIFAFSFYYDRLTSANLVPEQGGTIKIDKILEVTKKICNNVDSTEFANAKESEFLCMDLTYIYTLLTQGLGINLEQIIHVYKEINDMEISWALGAALHMMND